MDIATIIGLIGGTVLVVPGDVTKVEDVRNVIEQTITTFGKIDILVNNAGIGDRHRPTIRVTDPFWDQVIGIDLTSVFHFCREALKYMVQAEEGVIVNVSSIGGVYGNAGAPYSVASGSGSGFDDRLGHRRRSRIDRRIFQGHCF